MYRKRISATEAIDHPFLELAHHRGLGNRIALDRHRAYMFRRKWEVCLSVCLSALLLRSLHTSSNGHTHGVVVVVPPMYFIRGRKNGLRAFFNFFKRTQFIAFIS